MGPLEFLEEFENILERIEPTEVVEVPLTPLELILNVSDSLELLRPTGAQTGLNTLPLEKLEELLYQIDRIEPTNEVSVSSKLPIALTNITMKLGEMITGVRQETLYEKRIADNKQQLSSTRVHCPIRKEVYLIDGKCHY